MDSTADELDLTFLRAIEGAESDVVAIETLSSIVGSNQMLAKRLAEKIGERLHSNKTSELVNVLDVLENCMSDANNEMFRYEIGRFKFLNEIVKVISPTRATRIIPTAIRDRIMDLMLIWTRLYPQVPKIKEAYDILLKQGVIHVAPKDHQIERRTVVGQKPQVARRPTDTQFDEIPKHLWTSTDPADVQAANLMVEKVLEKEKRLEELRLKYVAELKEATEIASVLGELLDTHSAAESTEDDTALINEMFEKCRAKQVCISRYAVDPNNRDLATSLATNDRLLEVMQRYRSIIIEGKPNNTPQSSMTLLSNTDLLTTIMSSPPLVAAPTIPLNIPLSDPMAGVLDDIFLQSIQPDGSSNFAPSNLDLLQFSNEHPPHEPVFQSASVLKPNVHTIETKKPSPTREKKVLDTASDFFGLGSTISQLKISLVQSDKKIDNKPTEASPPLADVQPPAIDEETDSDLLTEHSEVPPPPEPETSHQTIQLAEIPLSELSIDLDHIIPSSIPSKTIMDESNGLKIILHFALNKPRSDVAVIVITTTNQSSETVTGFELDASIRKPCKVCLLPASGHELLAVKPFRPPTQITQVLLVANKEAVYPLRITCIVSYCLGDDPDPIKESLTIGDLPPLHDQRNP